MSTLFVDTINEKTSGNGIYIPGHVIQFVSTTYSTIHSNTSSSFTDTGFDVTITPQSASSKIYIVGNFSIYLSGNVQNNVAATAIYRDDTTKIAEMTVRQYDYGSSGILVERPVTMTYFDSPATTSAVKYTLYTKITSGSNIIFNDDSDDSSNITLMEIAQ